MIENKEPDENQIFSEKEEALIKNAFARLDIKLGVTDETPQYLKKSFARKLDKLLITDNSFYIKWKGFVVSLITAFSLGSLISYFLIMPAMVTRSIDKNDKAVSNESINPPTTTSIDVQNPEDYAFMLISMALKIDLEINIQKIGDKTILYIWPFKPDDQSQEEIRQFLKLSPDVGGRVTAILHKKS